MVNVQAFVVIISFCSLFSAVCWILLLAILNRIDYKIDRIYHYSMDIYNELEEINHRCYLISDDCRSNTIVLHSIEQKLIRDIPTSIKNFKESE